MTIAFVGKAPAIVQALNTSTTTGFDTSGANLLVVAIAINNQNAAVVTDSVGGNSNTWTALTVSGGTAPTGSSVQLFYCLAPTHVGTGHTFTVTVSGATSIVAYAFSGVSALDAATQGNATNVANNGGTSAPAGNNELIFAATGGDFDPTAINSSFTGLTHTGFLTATAYGLGGAYLIQTTGASVTPTWTYSAFNANSSGGGYAIAAFTAAAGGGATTYTLTGPSSGTTSVASTNFTVQAVGTPSGSVTITPATSGTGTFSPTSVTLAATLNSSATFTYTPGVSETATISTTSGGALTNPAGVSYTSSSATATSYTFTAPSPNRGVRGSASGNFTVTPVGGNYTGTITIQCVGGGLSTPANDVVKTFSGTSSAQTFTITPTAKGVVTLTPVASPSLGTAPAVLSYVALPKVKIVFDGDSLTYGQNASSGAGTVTGTTYPGVVFTQLQGASSLYTGTNLGTAGRRLDTMLSTEAGVSRVQPAFDATFDYNILVIQGGTNDLDGVNDGTHSGVATPATVWSNMVTYLSNAQGYGFLPIVQTITPAQPSGGPATFNETRDQFNDLIRANWKSSKACAISDTAIDSRIGWDGSETNTTYYNADKVHLTDAGYAIVAGYATEAIQSVIDGATNVASTGGISRGRLQ